ncbi:MAG: hypothetical protein K8U57_28405 [Planctomycetes bacterium]|nr:hypothetical protein [Planctomycetota bacterium]
MAKLITGNALLSKHVTRRDRVLLLNPPVEETRYSWLRWNQPLDLLKLGSHLKSEVGCGVELLDCMKPDATGSVKEDWLPRDRRYHTVKGERYPMRRYGLPYADIGKHLESVKRDDAKRMPSQVWVTSLCSYWYGGGLAQTCRVIRETLPDTEIMILGQAARLLPKQVADGCAADYVVTKVPSLPNEPSALELYGTVMPQFLGLQLHPKLAIAEVKAAVERGILKFTFFDDDICRDGGEPLREIFEKTKDLHKHLRYHLICGLHPAKVTPAVATVIADKKVAESHFEEADTGGEMDVEVYRQVRSYLREAGLIDVDNRLSGFVWIGRPREKLEQIVARSFHVLNHLEGLILKPFSPTPGSPEHLDNKAYLAGIPVQNWSPHFFPFAELNGIAREEYHDLYRMAAFLNEKIRDGSFDFLKGTLGADMLRESLRKEVWKLEPSPLRVVN